MTGDLMNPVTLRFLETCGQSWLAKTLKFRRSGMRSAVV
jgi:hypothetical protein